jgi:hypothetical protein
MRYSGLLSVVLFLSIHVFSQKQGFIVRQATLAAGRLVLDPNSDGYTSKTTAGFNGDDVANSEIPYKIVAAIGGEPAGDLRRGSAHSYSDFVPDANNEGFYVYFTGTNLLFRMRLGAVSPGASGYSVLLDTDGKFGPTGTNADPNYQPTTTGSDGNPGFEIEVVLESGSRIAIYNVDGTSTPVLIKAYNNWQDMSQVSLAATSDNANPDFFLDYYIPFSDLIAAPFNLTVSSKLRMVATTVTASKAAIGGPKSDIYGLNDAGYTSINKEYEDYIESQPPFSVNDVTGNGPGIGTICTPPPVLNGPVGAGNVTVSGTWTKSPFTGSPATATITVYKNGTAVGAPIANVASGATWSINLTGLVQGDVITAKAQSTGESTCQVSNAQAAQSCNTVTRPDTVGLRFTCSSVRGMAGTMPNGKQVRLYFIDKSTTPPTTSLKAGPTGGSNPATDMFGYSSATTWFYNGTINGGGVDVCAGGQPDITTGTYYVTTNVPGSTCESAPVFTCVGIVTPAAPTISQPLYDGATQIAGSAPANSTLQLWVNGQSKSPITATAAGTYVFTGLSLVSGDHVEIRFLSTGNCISNVAKATVSCYTDPPLISADNNNQLASGAPIKGMANPAGTVIRVFTSAAVLVATTTVQPDGTWSTGNAGTTPMLYNAVAGTSYYATAQNGQCAVSVNSGTSPAAGATLAARCGSITSPITAGAASVSGTLASAVANTTVRLYQDGISIGTVSTSTTSWTIAVAATALYPGGVLTIGVQEANKKEVLCAASVVVACATPPSAPLISPANTTISKGHTVTYTISNAVNGSFYGLADGSTGESLSQGVWAPANGNLSIVTDAFTTTGIYNIQAKATSLNGVTMCTSTPALVTLTVQDIALPITIVQFNVVRQNNNALLTWSTASEQNSSRFEIESSIDGNNFIKMGEVAAAGNSNTRVDYNYTDKNISRYNSNSIYYRLKQIDIDGKFTYSNILLIKLTENNSNVRVYPIPFRTLLTIGLPAGWNGSTSISLVDMNGRILYSRKENISMAQTNIVISGLSALSAGSYILTLRNNKNEERMKVMKE